MSLDTSLPFSSESVKWASFLTDPQFFVNSADLLRDVLDNHGVAVLRGAIPQTDARVYADAILCEAEKAVPGLDVNNPLTFSEWNKATMGTRGMIVQHRPFSASEQVWDVRTDVRVQDAFAALHKTERGNLITSMDAVALLFPPRHTNMGYNPDPVHLRGLHLDTSLHDPLDAIPSVQSLVNLAETHIGDGTFACIPGTHKFFDAARKVCKKKGWLPEKKGQWFLFEDQNMLDTMYRDSGIDMRSHVRFVLEPGDQVFWYSHTVHCGVRPERAYATPRNRLCVYVCMHPYPSDMPPAKLFSLGKRRINAFRDQRVTSHHPIKFTLFPTVPRSYGKTLRTYVPPPKAYFQKGIPDRVMGLIWPKQETWDKVDTGL